MSCRPLVFTKTDLARAIKATIEAGVEVGRVEITKSGSIVIYAAGKPDDEKPETDLNEWDNLNGDR